MAGWPNYGKCYRTGLPISTAFTESAVNEAVAKRRNKHQPMRWNRYPVQPFLAVRVHVRNSRAFRTLHRGLRVTEMSAGPSLRRTTTIYAPHQSHETMWRVTPRRHHPCEIPCQFQRAVSPPCPIRQPLPS
jgi:hypothetical protein